MTALPDDLVTRVTSTHPLPIADAVGALAAADGPFEARDRVVECFRAAIRLAAALALAARVQYGPGDEDDADQVRELVHTLRRRSLTDGQWVGLARELLRPWKERAGDHVLPELVGMFHGREAKRARKAVDGLLEMRKAETVAHGAAGDDATLAEILARRLPQLEAFLTALEPMWQRVRLAVPLAAPDARDRQRAWSLMRDTPPRGRWPKLELQGHPLPPGKPVLVDAEGSGVLALHPICLVQRPTPEQAEELFLLDGARKRGAVYVAFPSTAERCETEVWSRLDEALGGGAESEDEGVPGLERPYRGLEPFDAAHAGLFFGREALAEELANRVRRHPFVTVTGPSGSGKSSLLRAGVFPSLDATTVIGVRPGAEPIAHLGRRVAEALGADGAEETLARAPEELGAILHRWARERSRDVIVCVDQGEELVTLCRDEDERDAFTRAVASAGADAGGPVRVVVCAREDFFGRLAMLPGWRDAFAREVTVVTTPERDDLERALTNPLALFGYAFEDARLVAEMIDPVVGRPAALAMLQFCADRMWERRDRAWKRLTREAHDKVGGVEGAMASHAEATLATLTAHQRTTARALLLRLVTADGTRAVVPRAELVEAAPPREGAAILDRLVEARLLVAGEAEAGAHRGEALIELAHEALLTHWERLRTWLTEDHELVAVRARIAIAAARWDGEGRPVDLLLGDGKPLAEGEELVARRGDRLRAVEVDFVRASAARAGRRRTAKRAAVIGLAALAAVASAASVYAIGQKGRAERARDLADSQRAVAVERSLDLMVGAGREELLDGKPGRALPYFAAAYEAGRRDAVLRYLLARALRGAQITDPVRLRAHREGVMTARFDPRGTRVVTAGLDGEVLVWDLATAAIERRLVAGGGGALFAAFSPDGERLLATTFDGAVSVWDEGDDAPVFVHRGHGATTPSAAWSPDGAWIATVGVDGTARVVDAASGVDREVLDVGAGARAVDVHPDGRSIAIGTDDGRIVVWRPFDGGARRDVDAHLARVNTVEFSADGDVLVSSSHDKSARVWDPVRGALRAVLPHPEEVRAATFGPGGAIATACLDDVARVWDAGAATVVAELRAHRGNAVGVAYDADHTRLATASLDGDAIVHDAAAGRIPRQLDGHASTVHTALAAGDDLVTAGFDNAALAWRDGDVVTALGGHGAAIRALAVAPGARRHATVDREGRLIVWSAETATAETWVVAHRGGATAVAFDAAGETLVTGGDDGVAHVWTPQGERLASFAHRSPVTGVAFAGSAVVVLGADGGVTVWAEGGDRARSFAAHPDGAALVASADGRLVATAAAAGDVTVWDPATWTAVAKVRHGAPVAALAIARGRLAVAGGDRVTVWNPTTGEAIATLRGAGDDARAVAVARDGRVAAGDGAGTVAIWDVATGAIARLLRAHREPVTGLAFTGEHLVTTSEDSNAAAWDVTSGDRAALLGGHTERVKAIALAGERVLTAAGDGAYAWQLDGRRTAELAGHASPVVAAAAREGGWITGDELGTVAVWDAGGTRRAIEAHRGEVRAVAALSGGRVVSAGSDGVLAVWSADGEPSGRLERDSPVTALAVAGDTVAAGFSDGSALVWSPGGDAVELPRHRAPVRDVTFDGTGRVVTASDDGTAIVSKRDGTFLVTLDSGAAPLVAVAFAHGAELVITAGEDGKARVWDAATGKILDVLDGHTRALYDLAVVPHGDAVATAGADERARLWPLPLEDRPVAEVVRAAESLSPWRLDGTRLVRSQAVTDRTSAAH